MKKMIASSALFTTVLVATVAHADAMTVAQIHASAQKSVAKFEADHPTEASGFTGYKVWRSADLARVKVYYTLNGVNGEANYYCEDHGGAIGIDCHDQ